MCMCGIDVVARDKALFNWPHRRGNWLAFAVAILLLDQLCKFAAQYLLASGEAIAIFSFLHLALEDSRDAVVSLFVGTARHQSLMLSFISIVVSLVMIDLLRKPAGSRLFRLGLVVVLGGVMSNLADRIRLGHVVDFLNVHFLEWQLSAFNLADIAIVFGIALLILSGLYEPAAARHTTGTFSTTPQSDLVHLEQGSSVR